MEWVQTGTNGPERSAKPLCVGSIPTRASKASLFFPEIITLSFPSFALTGSQMGNNWYPLRRTTPVCRASSAVCRLRDLKPATLPGLR